MLFGKENSNEKKSIILIFILFFNLFLMSFNIILKNEKSLLETTISSIFSPIQVGIQKSIDFFSYEIRRYIFLKNMYHQYYGLKNKFKKLKYENYLLRTRLDQMEFLFKVKNQKNGFLGAELISVDNSIPYNCIIINKGSLSGIKKNMVLLNENGELVGRVIDPISPLTAKVRLITSRIGGVGSYIKKNKLEGFLSGNNQQICNFKYLLDNAPVENGDEVITSGTDQIFPPYIPIGKVVEIEKEYLTLKVQVKPFFVEKSIKKLIVMTHPIKKSEK